MIKDDSDTQSIPRRGGRPRFSPTAKERAQVKTLSGLGITHDGISTVLGITPPTLRKYFRHELNVGEHEANAQVSASLFRQATHPTKPNTIAAIFWLKCRAGWRDHDLASAGTGKKEQQQEQAVSVAEGRRFAPGSAPPALKLVK
jgi:hypothetical protein